MFANDDILRYLPNLHGIVHLARLTGIGYRSLFILFLSICLFLKLIVALIGTTQRQQSVRFLSISKIPVVSYMNNHNEPLHK